MTAAFFDEDRTMRRYFTILTLTSVLLLLAVSPAIAKDLVYTTGNHLALDGHDPVAFFTESKPVPGKASITANHRGATYRFASAANRDTFNSDKDRYAPHFGGYCAFGASLGSLFPTKIETWQIIDDRLVLNKDLGIKKKFDKNKAKNLAKADKNWPGLVAKKGK